MAEEIFPPLRADVLIDEFGKPTLVFSEYLETISGAVTVINSNTTTILNGSSINLALINDIRDQIGSGDPLTWDDTGFTWDGTFMTFDRTEA